MIYFVELFFRAGRGGGMLIGLYFLIAINEAINRHVSFILGIAYFYHVLAGPDDPSWSGLFGDDPGFLGRQP